MEKFLQNITSYLGINRPETTVSFFSTRRNVLYARILIITASLTLFTLIKDLIDQGLAPIPFMDSLCFLAIVSAFLLNKQGYQITSRLLFLFLLNTLIGIVCAVVPADRIAFVYFFALIAVAYVVFDDSQRKWRYVFTVLPVLFIIILISTDFRPLGDIQLSVSSHGQRNMIINQIIAALIISLCFNFLVRTSARSEEVLHSFAVEAEKGRENLEKINGELDRFVYSASHDLRSPLLSIQGLVKVALNETNEEGSKKYFSLISDRVTKLDEFIKEIIEYSRNARTEIKYEEVNLKELFNESIAHLQYLEGTENIEIYYSGPDQNVQLDRARTKVILSNILANAIKYHNPRQENPWIEVKIELTAETCKVKISDNGSGIPHDKLEFIFDMFFRASDRSSGSGLGLFIVKETVIKLNGKVTVQSEYGKGSEFIITLPLQKV
jgi:signal transduction histidine kinase